MKMMITLIIMVGGSTAFAKESVICNGAAWNYKFIFDSNRCFHEQKARTDIPGFYKKGHINSFTGKNELTTVDCWKSLASIQMDGARCCLDTSVDPDSCRIKNLKY